MEALANRYATHIRYLLLVIAVCAVTAVAETPALADNAVEGVWQNQFGNVLVTSDALGHYVGTMLNDYTSPAACSGTSKIVVAHQQVWTFADTPTPSSYTGTFNFILNGSTPGCRGGNTTVAAVSAITPNAAPEADDLKICPANPETGAPASFDATVDSDCEDETRLAGPTSVTVAHKVTDYLTKISGGKCVKSGPRKINITFHDDWATANAPGLTDPVETVRFYTRNTLDAGYNIDAPADVPGASTSGHFAFETNRLNDLYIKVVMTTFSGKVYTVDSRHLPHAMLPKPLPQHCVKTSNNS